jgi:hypothetical protein
MDMIESTLVQTDDLFSVFLRQLAKQGWESPARFMFGRVHMRADWPLAKKVAKEPSQLLLDAAPAAPGPI